jgi:hypothetical protein
VRVFAAFNNDVEQLVALEGALHDYVAQGAPEIDSGKTAQFINTDRRLGNTGAATFCVQTAHVVMGSYLESEVPRCQPARSGRRQHRFR